jgi:cytochrome c peroxidase
LATLKTLWLSAPLTPPADPSNRVADDSQAARLGKALFFDTAFSANGKVSCASCHQPDHGFTDARAVGRGIASGARRTMPVAEAVHSPWQFWDGRADSLWAQALGPVENPVEHGFTRGQVAATMTARHRGAYEAVFGRLPPASSTPARATPVGDSEARAAWAKMPVAAQTAVNQVFANFGKAVAAYERTLSLRPSRFDDYLDGLFGPAGDGSALSADEAAGARLFIGKAQCVTCHNGPMLSNQGFANTGVPVRRGYPADPGRARGVRIALADPFNCEGAFSDAGPAGCEELDFAVVDSAAQQGAFKVPSLRGVARRAPYMHAGQLGSLRQVIDHYDRAPTAATGATELQPLHLSPAERRQLVVFLKTLDEAPAQGRSPMDSHD